MTELKVKILDNLTLKQLKLDDSLFSKLIIKRYFLSYFLYKF